MFEKLQNLADKIIAAVVGVAQRNAWLVISVAIALALGVAHYTAKNIAITTDTEQMLSAELPWRAAYDNYKKEFPHYADNIVVVIEGHTRDIAQDAATELAAALRAEGQVVEAVFYPRDEAFFRHNQLLYLEPAALQNLATELSAAQPFLARLSAQTSSNVLFDLLAEAFEPDNAEQASRLLPAVGQITASLDELSAGDALPMSWQALIAGEPVTNRRNREIIVIQPHLDFSALLPAKPAIELIRSTVANLSLDKQHGISVRLTGPAALSFDELQSVITGSQNAGTAALVMVLLCLLLGLRSLVLVFATLTSLIIGLIFTAGFAIFTVGTLNMISIAFAVLYVGLGVDFAIHICLRYRETLNQQAQTAALNQASRHVGSSLILCALTTAIGFYAFIPTAYRGVAELGLIAGTGMFISLLVSLILLPALLHVLPPPRIPGRATMLPSAIAEFPKKHARAVLGVAAFVWIIAALSIPGTAFDHDPINLNDQHAESVVTYRDLLTDHDNSPLAIPATAESRELIDKYKTALKARPEVGSVRTIDAFVPAQQTQKLAIVDDLALLLGPDLEPTARPQLNTPATLKAIEALRIRLAEVEAGGLNDQRELAAAALEQALTRYQRNVVALDEGEQALALAQLEIKLLDSLPGRLKLLNDSLNPEEFGADQLPLSLRQRWIGHSGVFRVEVYPASALERPHEMRRFVNAVVGVVGNGATGAPVINLGASEAVKTAFIQAFSYAFIVISALLWLILRSMKEVAIVLSPLVLAGLITCAVSVAFSLPFNFANIIALPLLLGIGVDSALHILHRFKTAMPNHGNLLQTSTARAVLFSALTTTVSFGNLATSNHAGTASMGVMLTIGVVSTLLCTLLILPALLQQYLLVKD